MLVWSGVLLEPASKAPRTASAGMSISIPFVLLMTAFVYGCESKTLGSEQASAAIPRHRFVTESPGLRQAPLRQGSFV